ncbi:MAG: phage tail protein [Candidatus Promineifilaceae bacterium]
MADQPTILNSLQPLATFRFALDLSDGRGYSGVFTECKLPDVEWDVEELKEGGQNAFVHQLPSRRKMSRVTLKYGLTKDYDLLDWYAKMMEEDFKDLRRTVSIEILDSEHKPILRWNLHDAFPIKVTWPELRAGDNTIAIQSLELACGRVEFEKNPK